MSAGPSAQGVAELFPEYGISQETGEFKRPHIDVILEASVRETEQQLGYEIPGPESLEAQTAEMIALWSDTYFEVLEALYYSAYFETAHGRQLDSLLSLIGFKRLPRREATGEVTFYPSDPTGNDSDVLIPAGTRVATRGDETTPEIYFEVTSAVTLPANQTEITQVPIRALDPNRTTLDLTDEQTGAETNVPAGAIKRIVDSINGVSSVENAVKTGGSGTRADGTDYSFVTGRDRERDSAYKRRYENSQALGGKATLDAIEANIRNAGGGDIVQAVNVGETLPINSDGAGGYTGRQVEPVVALKENTQANRDAIAQAIFDSRAGGIMSVGDLSGTAHWDDGTAHTTGLGFTLATEVPIYVSAELVVGDTFPSDGVEQIKANLLDYIGGRDENGDYIAGESTIGDDIYYSIVYGSVVDNDIPGIIDSTSVTMGTAASPTGTSTIAITDSEVARTTPDQIAITTTPGTRS